MGTGFAREFSGKYTQRPISGAWVEPSFSPRKNPENLFKIFSWGPHGFKTATL